MPKEPQSNGSPRHAPFYESRRDSELQAQQSAGWLPQASEIDEQPVQKVSARKSGAKRGSFFRDRDYRR